MKDEKYTPAVGEWLKGREVTPPDSKETARQVAARLPQVRQRRRWWPMRRQDRNTEASMTSPAAGRQPAPVASSLTNSTNATGGIRSIFSATSYVAAAVAVALLGGFLFMSVMTQSPGDGNPAAGGSVSPGAPSSVEPTQPTETQDKAGEDSATSPKEDDSLKLRTPMATALAIGLLASPAAVVTAQTELMAPAAVTGTASFYDEEAAGTRQFADGALRSEGVMFTSTWDSSDPA